MRSAKNSCCTTQALALNVKLAEKQSEKIRLQRNAMLVGQHQPEIPSVDLFSKLGRTFTGTSVVIAYGSFQSAVGDILGVYELGAPMHPSGDLPDTKGA